MHRSIKQHFVVWTLIGLPLLTAPIRGETPVQAWIQRYSVPPGYTATATALAVDSTNNVIVTGYGPRNGTGTYFDYATIKYSSTGVPLWTNYYNGPGSHDDQAMAIAVDSNDNVIVTGNSSIAGADSHDFD